MHAVQDRIEPVVRTLARNPSARRAALRRTRVRLLGLAFAFGLLLSAGPLRADILVFHNGHKLEGRVTVDPASGDYIVVTAAGTVSVPPSKVKERIFAPAPIDEFQRRLGEIADDDLAALVELAAWADFKGLERSAIEVYRRVLGVDPHHEAARERLGYVLHRNRWVRRDQLEKAGLVQHGGRWMTPKEVEAAQSAEVEQELATLFKDLEHENRFIREGAFYRLFENRDPRAIPYLEKLVESDSPLQRMVAGRVLGNHGYEVAAGAIYPPLLREQRDEIATAWITVLRSQSDARLATRIAEDLTRVADPLGRRRLLQLAEACPHRELVPRLIDVMSDPNWASAADGVLTRILGVESRSAGEWRAYWRHAERSASPDLGSGWLQPKERPKR